LVEETTSESAALIGRVNDLEIEVSVWKKAVVDSRESQARETPTLNGDIISVPEPRLVLCVIDGTRTMFSTRYLCDGEAGGRHAGEDLIHLIQEKIGNGPEVYSTWIHIYLNKGKLAEDLVSKNQCDVGQLEAFLIGLCGVSSSLALVDVVDKRDADQKMRSYLYTFSALPQTSHVLFAGAQADMLLSTRLFDKCSIRPILTISLPFYVTKKVLGPTRCRPVYPSSLPTTSLLTCFCSTPTLTVLKENPPPCNEFYLMDQDCSKGRCKYSHQYDLTPDQLAILAKNAKQSPCWFANNEQECPYGPRCCWGHTCPHGVKCHYLAKDRCRFKGGTSTLSRVVLPLLSE
ncbi:hypothetical protein K488DRAFT_47055, partial [Vararia minispora EC-137]